jgi:hypothetical protein
MVSQEMRRELAAGIARGDYNAADVAQALGLEPGERLAPTGVIIGSGAHPGIPRFGADQTDNDYPADAS